MSVKPPDPKFVLRGSQDPMASLCFLEEEFQKTSQLLATGSQNGMATLWNLEVSSFYLSMNGSS